MPPDLPLRRATASDFTPLLHLIERSVRELSRGFYTEAEIESGLRYVFGPDSALIADGTYFVITDGDRLAAAGGWSRRRTLYGGDQATSRLDDLLDPRTEPAKIRAFFVSPDYARRGLGRRLLEHCAAEAAKEGFTSLELMATLPGVPLYAALGFIEVEASAPVQPDGVALRMVRMRRASINASRP